VTFWFCCQSNFPCKSYLFTGHFVCRSCKKSGKWCQLQDNISVVVKERADGKK
jgi:hypothetical protein